jgi:PKD repeat protein
MRSIHLMAATTVILLLATACGGDDGGVGPNSDPVADFTPGTCTAGATCTFTDKSTDPDGNNTITSRSWDFGDGTTSQEVNPNHEFARAGTYDVKLTVTDNGGKTNTKTTQVTVTAVGPTASFTYECDGPACTFTNTSTPAGSFTSNWVFGDDGTSQETNPVHTFEITETTTFTVTLTATNPQGGIGTTTQSVTVTPAATLECAGGSNCTLDLPVRARLTATVTVSDCEFRRNAFSITAPIQELVFPSGCTVRDGTSFEINNAQPFDAGTRVEAQFTQGNPGPNDPPRGTPALRIRAGSAYPVWTLEYDDGGNPGGTGEPDFDDIVLEVRATPVP